VIFAVAYRARAIASERTDSGVVLWSGLLVAGAIFAASFGLLMQGPIAWCAYLQPLLVAVFPVAIAAPTLGARSQRLYGSLCVALALVAAVRAIGMGTWGVACALDVSQRNSARVVQETYERAAPGSVVLASSAFLYEGDRHPSLRVLHSDWIASHRPRKDIADCIVALRPTTMILTQFDYYRGCGTALAALKARPELADLRIRNTASVRPPDAVAALSRVVQHVSWAPVIIQLKWR